ncbi:MAG: FAD-binding oxidoreductase [Methylobacterium mesophilicum]|nr:FAD-binding oxidoreductase [Methylobacterium mesophilicum]
MREARASVEDARAREALAARLGPSGFLSTPDTMTPYTRDWLDRFGDTPLGVARPAGTEEVAATLRLCREHGLAVTPQGGNTGLNGGSVLGPAQRGIVLSLGRMNRLLDLDPLGFTATVEAGMVLSALHERLAAADLSFPLHLGAEGSAQVGGLIATNAGGSHAFRFGAMGDLVLGLEVVLPDGTVWNGARALLKDNAGYQLRRLFAGSEGTLGVVTKAVLRLQPAPRARATALLALEGFEEALEVGRRLRRDAGEMLSAMEFFPETGLALLLRHVPGTMRPFARPHPLYLLVELSSSAATVALEALLEATLAEAFEAGLVADALIAANASQRAAFWRLREEMPEGQRREGAQIKHDVSVPVARLGAFVAEATRAVEAVLPGLRVNPFGHLGDGNVHFNLSPPEGEKGFDGREGALSRAIHAVTIAHAGSIAAEHGLGQAKVALADETRDGAERALMRRIKQALDPDWTLNPGKIVPEPDGTTRAER